MPEATLTTKGQVAIAQVGSRPPEARNRTRLDFVIEDDGTVVVKPVTRHVANWRGCYTAPGGGGSRPPDGGRGNRHAPGGRFGAPADDRPRYESPDSLLDEGRPAAEGETAD